MSAIQDVLGCGFGFAARRGVRQEDDSGNGGEELVAELGSVFLCADVELTPEIRDDHAFYVAFWLEVLNNDNRAVFAAAHAQRAVDYLHRLQPQHTSARGSLRAVFSAFGCVVCVNRALSWHDMRSQVGYRDGLIARRTDIVIVSCLQRCDIAAAHVASSLQVGASPRKPFSAEPHHEQVRQ